jgi:hypothetical protein
MKRSLLVPVLLLAVPVAAGAATTPFALVLLSPGEPLVHSARADQTDWQPVEAGFVVPYMLVCFAIVDLAGIVVATSPQAVSVKPGEAVSFAK